MRILIIGNAEPTHVGGHFLQASRSSNAEVAASLMSVREAYQAPRLVRALYWHLLGKRPARLQSFSEALVRRCAQEKPDLVLATGIVPVTARALAQLRQMGVWTANFLTDDPWNKAHHAPWFMSALPRYNHIFTPRHANEPELRALNGPTVSYLPFAYAPEIHFPPVETDPQDLPDVSGKLLFIGGADDERAEIMGTLHQRGIPISVWGGYWAQRPALRAHAHGHAGPAMFRRLVGSAAINLCLVRRANRDGHSMRTFELPAVGGCMLVEDTEDHRAFFGAPGQCVRYFASLMEMETEARELMQNAATRRHLAEAAHRRICVEGRHTYADRLQTIINMRAR